MTTLGELRLDEKERRPRRLSWWPLLAVGVVLLAATVWSLVVLVGGGETGGTAGSGRMSARHTEPAAGEVRVSTGSPRSGGAAGVSAGGYVEARRSVVVFPGRDGLVARVLVTLGQPVREGDLLLSLDSSVEQARLEMARAEVETARARLRRVMEGARSEEVVAADAERAAMEAERDQARQELERLERLSRSGAATQAEVDRARARLNAAEARLEAQRARERLVRRGSRAVDVLAARAEVERAEASLRMAEARVSLAEARAPFDGVVVAVDAEPGGLVSLQGGRGGVEVADLSELRVRVEIPEMRIGRVRLGAPADVTIDALGRDAELLAGSVVEIAPVADRRSNTVEVVVALDDPPALVRPNMSARVTIHVPSEREGGSE